MSPREGGGFRQWSGGVAGIVARTDPLRIRSEGLGGWLCWLGVRKFAVKKEARTKVEREVIEKGRLYGSGEGRKELLGRGVGPQPGQ